MIELKQKEGYDLHGTQITVLMDQNDNPRWVAREVAEVLGFRNATHATKPLGVDEKQTLTNSERLTTSRNPDVILANEAGLYKLILRSRKPEAEAFQRWVTHEVLPVPTLPTGDRQRNVASDPEPPTGGEYHQGGYPPLSRPDPHSIGSRTRNFP